MIEFEWDLNNIKHICEDYPERQNTVSEVESIFYDPNLIMVAGKRFSAEQRLYAVGLSNLDNLRFVVFTVVGGKIRPISCWPANSQTKRQYYESIEN